MSNCPHVCLDHRYVARSHKWSTRYCPVDGAALLKFHPSTPIPKRTDDRGWEKLRESYQRGQRNQALADFARHTDQNAHQLSWRMRRSAQLLEKWKGAK